MKICYAKKTKEHFDYVFNSFALVKVIPCNWKHIDKETLFCRNVLYLRFLGRPWKHKPRSQTLDSLTDGGGGGGNAHFQNTKLYFALGTSLNRWTSEFI